MFSPSNLNDVEKYERVYRRYVTLHKIYDRELVGSAAISADIYVARREQRKKGEERKRGERGSIARDKSRIEDFND